jgi:hypothetical protein
MCWQSDKSNKQNEQGDSDSFFSFEREPLRELRENETCLQTLNEETDDARAEDVEYAWMQTLRRRRRRRRRDPRGR